jgi:hypothetical protein
MARLHSCTAALIEPLMRPGQASETIFQQREVETVSRFVRLMLGAGLCEPRHIRPTKQTRKLQGST